MQICWGNYKSFKGRSSSTSSVPDSWLFCTCLQGANTPKIEKTHFCTISQNEYLCIRMVLTRLTVSLAFPWNPEVRRWDYLKKDLWKQDQRVSEVYTTRVCWRHWRINSEFSLTVVSVQAVSSAVSRRRFCCRWGLCCGGRNNKMIKANKMIT